MARCIQTPNHIIKATESSCGNYPFCGHRYPDCVDLVRILRNNRLIDPLNTGVDLREVSLAFNWLMKARRTNSNQPWEWQSAEQLCKLAEVGSIRALFAGLVESGVKFDQQNKLVFLPPQKQEVL